MTNHSKTIFVYPIKFKVVKRDLFMKSRYVEPQYLENGRVHHKINLGSTDVKDKFTFESRG